MASKKAKRPNQAEKKPKRTHFKKQHKNTDTSHTTTTVSSCSSLTTSFSPQDTNYSATSLSPAVLTSPGETESGGGGCCTPKAQKSRIPEMLTCPPAPKKQRVSRNCVLRRRQIVFFAPPEIELFFAKAHGR